MLKIPVKFALLETGSNSNLKFRSIRACKLDIGHVPGNLQYFCTRGFKKISNASKALIDIRDMTKEIKLQLVIDLNKSI